MDDSDPRTVELFVRTLAPPGSRDRQERIVERLLDLERSGAIDEVELTVWGNGLCLDTASTRLGTGAHVAEAVRAFRRWSEEKGASLEPFFTWSSVDSSISGECFDRVVLPQRCLAVYVNGAVVDVYPSRDASDTRSLEDGLVALEREAVGPPAATVLSEEVN